MTVESRTISPGSSSRNAAFCPTAYHSWLVEGHSVPAAVGLATLHRCQQDGPLQAADGGDGCARCVARYGCDPARRSLMACFGIW